MQRFLLAMGHLKSFFPYILLLLKLKYAPILLMDEATSALDNNNETEIQAAIKKLINGKTALVVAHRDITIDFCDEKYQLS